MDYPEVLAMNMFSSWLLLVILNTILLFRASKSFFSINQTPTIFDMMHYMMHT